MFERALSLRRKILRTLKLHLGVGKSKSLPRKPGAVIHKSVADTDVEGLERVDDGVSEIRCKKSDLVEAEKVVVRSPTARTAPEIEEVPLRELSSKTPLTIVVPPRPPVPVLAQSPLSTPESSSARAGASQTSSPSAADTQDFAAQVEVFQQVQQQLHKRAITRAQSLPVSVSDPMKKLRDSYIRIMHKMAQEEARTNPLSPASGSTLSIVDSDQARLFDYLHRRRTPADDEEEEFCRLAVMRTKFNRSQSTV